MQPVCSAAGNGRPPCLLCHLQQFVAMLGLILMGRYEQASVCNAPCPHFHERKY